LQLGTALSLRASVFNSTAAALITSSAVLSITRPIHRI
jgi:hypothetical protein